VRLALLSDQHGNDVAFAAAVADVERVGVDRVVCLGDVAQGGAQPVETLDRLRRLRAGTVLGNADAFLLEVPSDSPEPVTDRMLEIREWTLSRLSPSHGDQLRAFQDVIDLELDGHRIRCFHGSPRSFDDVLIPEREDASLEPFLADDSIELLAGGHTHKQWTRRIGEALFVNPGSVGLAYDHHQPDDDFKLSPHAEYAIVFADRLGLSVEFRRVPYSLAALREAVQASGRPAGDEFLAQWRAFGDVAG
jgi:putative phosphoesterase